MLDSICAAVGERGLGNFKCVFSTLPSHCRFLSLQNAVDRAPLTTKSSMKANPSCFSLSSFLPSLLSSALPPRSLWTYNPLNNDTWGDSWNGENFSWFSMSDRTEEALERAEKEGGEEARLNVGARALDAVQVRFLRLDLLAPPPLGFGSRWQEWLEEV